MEGVLTCTKYRLRPAGPNENADDDLFFKGRVAEIIRSWTMIISFGAFMWSQSAVADPKSFPAQQM